MKTNLVSPSILNADFSRLTEECRSLENSGADWLHCDVMDGVFVPNKALSVGEVSAIHKAVSLPLDVHLMVANPREVVKSFVEAGAHVVTIHIEVGGDVAETAKYIRELGAVVGLSVKPATPVEELLPFAEYFDLILIMTVEPGFGGQAFLPDCLNKISVARSLFPDKLIEVDGGINDITGAEAVRAGADILVAGSYIIKSPDRKAAVQKLKSC